MSHDSGSARTTNVFSFVALLISMLALLYPAPVRQWVDDRLGSLVPNTYDVRLPARALTVSTSGFRQDLDGDIWSGGNLLDDDPKTAWSECAVRNLARRSAERRNPCDEPDVTGVDLATVCGNPDVYAADSVVQGVSEYVEFTLPPRTRLKAIQIRNGLQLSDKVFLQNPRVKSLQVTADQKDIMVLQLKDQKELQNFEIDTEATVIRLTIKETYWGQCLQGSLPYYYDTSLSDVLFIPKNVPPGGAA